MRGYLRRGSEIQKRKHSLGLSGVRPAKSSCATLLHAFWGFRLILPQGGMWEIIYTLKGGIWIGMLRGKMNYSRTLAPSFRA